MTEVRLTIEHEGIVYEPLLEGAVTVNWAISDQPGKLSFRVVNNGNLDFHEGDPVRFTAGGTPFFYGYVFSKSRDKAQLIDVTCYDQLRYLKNRFTYRYENQTASQVLKALADMYGLTCGEIADTEVAISRREDKAELMEMVETALDETWKISGEGYVLYDDYGRLTLKKAQDMRVDLLVCASTAENFSYESTIDGETYNSVYLYHMDKKTEEIQDDYLTQDDWNVARWGLLQLCDSVDDPTQLESQAKNLLSEYNRKYRYLSVSGALGDVRVRPGCQLPVQLTLGDVNAEPDTWLTVKQVSHRFEAGSHLMDMELSGGLFSE